MHLAQSLKYFDTKQVRLVELANASQSSQAMRNGTVDAAMLTLDEVLNLKQNGLDLRIVLVMDVSNGADVLMANPSIAKLADLRGKRVGVESSAVGAVMLDAALTTAGLSSTDVQLIPMPVNEHVAAYRDGKLDAIVTFEPSRTELLAQGAHILFDSSRIPGRIVDVLVVTDEAILNHSKPLSDMVTAHFKALDYLSKHAQDAANRIAPFLQVTADQVLPQFEGLKLPDLTENQAQLAGSSPKLISAAVNLRDLMLKQKLLSRSVLVDQLVDPSFLPPITK